MSNDPFTNYAGNLCFLTSFSSLLSRYLTDNAIPNGVFGLKVLERNKSTKVTN